ncbi:MAG: ribose 5-phosphate isomerase B [Proteobacteria bacterium]|nr:ribose 5-phosphate isomerase B [Pseudomonadota bacterium]
MAADNKMIALAADHGGFELKNRVAEFLQAEGYKTQDLGTYSDERVDYPDYGYALSQAIADGKAGRGIAICGSGIGISIALNRNPAVRAALCHDVTSARLARGHNDANVLVLGARLIGFEVALECVKIFLNTQFEGGRHAERVKKLGKC